MPWTTIRTLAATAAVAKIAYQRQSIPAKKELGYREEATVKRVFALLDYGIREQDGGGGRKVERE